jgi:hypothetical protein
MARKKQKPPFCDGVTFVLCVCFWIVTDFTKYFYADFSGCDRRQTLLCDSAPGCMTRKAKNHF